MTQIEQTYACMHARSSSVAPLKAAQEAGARLVAVREQAIRCVVSLVACLDVWAGPLKEAGQQARAAGMEQQHGSNGDAASEESSSASGATGPQENSAHGSSSGEAGRLGAVWAHKTVAMNCTANVVTRRRTAAHTEAAVRRQGGWRPCGPTSPPQGLDHNRTATVVARRRTAAHTEAAVRRLGGWRPCGPTSPP
eukprot:1158926-Pelagomonas_calceolata.AAC.4